MSKDKLRYQRLREQKRCTRCRNQDERTLQGFSVCESCKRKFEAYRKEYLARPGIAEQRRISSKNAVNRRYHKRQRNHQCVHCGVVLAADYFYTNCPKCRQQKAEHYQKKKTAGAATPNGQKENNSTKIIAEPIEIVNMSPELFNGGF